jgi:hypothetical protein
MSKKLGLGLVVTAILGIVLLALWITPARAAGGANWKVTVRNDTGYSCTVELFLFAMNKDATDKSAGLKEIPTGTSVTFETGSLCPNYLKGTIFHETTKDLKRACVNGTSSALCGAACWNTSWKICRKAGSEQDSLRDGDFGFCKQ